MALDDIQPENLDICDKIFERKEALVMHVKNHYREIECRACAILFPSEEELDAHRSNFHKKQDQHPQYEDSDYPMLRSRIGAKYEKIQQEEIIESGHKDSDIELSEYSGSSSLSVNASSETEDSESGGSSE